MITISINSPLSNTWRSERDKVLTQPEALTTSYTPPSSITLAGGLMFLGPEFFLVLGGGEKVHLFSLPPSHDYLKGGHTR